MVRFFWLELRRALRDNLVFVGCLVAFVALVQNSVLRGRVRQEDLGQIGDYFLVVVLVVSAVIQGAAAFPTEWRDRHWLQLFTLPLSRSRTWFATLTARSTGFAIGLVALQILRPSLSKSIDALEVVAWTALGAIPVLFLFGAAMTLLIRQRLLMYLSAMFLGTTVYLLLLIGTAHLTKEPGYHPIDYLLATADPIYNGPRIEALLLGLHILVACAILLAFSHYVFVQGEYNNSLRRCYTGVIGLLVLSSLVIVVGSGVLNRLYSFALPASSFVEFLRVAPDGNFAARFLTAYKRPGQTSLEIYDLKTSEKVVTLIRKGFLDWSSEWSRKSDLFYYLVEDYNLFTQLGLRQPSTSLWRLSLNSEQERLLGQTVGFQAIPDQGLLVVRESEEGSRVEVLSEVTHVSSVISDSFVSHPRADSADDANTNWLESVRIRSCPEGTYVTRPGSRLAVHAEHASGLLATDLPDGYWLIKGKDGNDEKKLLLPFLAEQFGAPRLDFKDLQGLYLVEGPCPIFSPDSEPLFFLWKHENNPLWGFHRFEKTCDCWQEIIPISYSEPPLVNFDFGESTPIHNQRWAEGMSSYSTISVRDAPLFSKFIMADGYAIHSLGQEAIELIKGPSSWKLGESSDRSFWSPDLSFLNFSPNLGTTVVLSCKEANASNRPCTSQIVRLKEDGPELVADLPEGRTRHWGRLAVDEGGWLFYRDPHKGISVYDREGQFVRKIEFSDVH